VIGKRTVSPAVPRPHRAAAGNGRVSDGHAPIVVPRARIRRSVSCFSAERATFASNRIASPASMTPALVTRHCVARLWVMLPLPTMRTPPRAGGEFRPISRWSAAASSGPCSVGPPGSRPGGIHGGVPSMSRVQPQLLSGITGIVASRSRIRSARAGSPGAGNGSGTVPGETAEIVDRPGAGIDVTEVPGCTSGGYGKYCFRRRTCLPISAQPRVYALSCNAFIGLPCPMNTQHRHSHFPEPRMRLFNV